MAAVICASLPGALQAEEALGLRDLLTEADANNPELAALKSRYEASGERVPQAAAFPDPMVSLGFVNVPVDSFAFDREDMTGKMIEVSQMFPFFGKRGIKKEAALHEARSVGLEFMDKRLTVRSDVKKTYYELYAVKKGLEVVRKNIELMEAFKKVAETRYSVGQGTLKDIVKAQVEVAMLIDKQLELQREERTKRAFLGLLLGRDAPASGRVEDISPTEFTPDREVLAAAAMESRPALQAAEERIKKGSAMVELARKEYYPDFTVAASYMQRETLADGMEQSDMLSASISINVPLWWKSKLEPGVREAAAERSMAEKERDAVRTEIYYRIDSLVNEVGQDDRILKLYKESIIPDGTDDLNSALAGYEVGKVGFLDLLDSRRTLFDYELGYYNMLAEREKAVAELEATVGVGFK